LAIRSATFARQGSSYATNGIPIGDDLLAHYKISTGVFTSVNGYVASRSAVVILDPSAKIDDDGTNRFEQAQASAWIAIAAPEICAKKPLPSACG